MTGLLIFREKIKRIYSQSEMFILPVVKFLLAFWALSVLNGEMGYMSKLDNMAIVLIVALMCSFLPLGAITFFAAVFSLLHMYALSLEVLLVGFVVYVLLFMLFIRFSSKESFVVLMTALLCVIKLPYIMPIVMGLLGTPASAVAVGCGVVVYYLINTITGNAPTIATMGDDEATAKLRLIVDGILDNKAMIVLVASFAITVIVVYLIRRMSIDYSWTIAIVAGVMANLVILLIGDLIYDTNVSVANAVLGSVLAIFVAKVVEFFRFCVDYSRTEKVQFEDDEYYYYVKAVPKMAVAATTKTVKRINTPTTGSVNRNVQAHRPGNSGRTVTTVRTGVPRNNMPANGRSPYGSHREHLSGGRSVTISSDNMPEEQTDDYEEIF